ncbi:MAG: HAD-IC family P-type ATPase [Erysipelotrichaceae bacterium]
MKKTLTGLTYQEVQEKINKNQVNHEIDDHSKSISSIIFQHVFTLFNGINIVLALLVLYTQQYINMLFMGIVFFNTCIGIIQEIRAKLTLDKLKLLTQSRYQLIRDGHTTLHEANELVLDDLLILKAGQQVPTDAIIIQGEVELNESLLTGESDTILKTTNNTLYSGSFVTSGEAIVKVLHVGKDNYIQTILNQAKSKKTHPSLLREALQLIIKYISVIIFPIGIPLFFKQYLISDLPLNDSILSTVAAMIGMIPEGLILLTSVSLALGAVSLTRKNTLTQELYSLETLARVDMLCLDKTGTLTTGLMGVEKIINYHTIDISNILANMMDDLKDDNATALAIKNDCALTHKMTAIEKVHFSSERKYSSVTYQNEGSFTLGAFHFLNIKDKHIEEEILKYTELGKRVLVLIQTMNQHTIVQGLVILSDTLRETASSTLNYFHQQKVAIKIISGDDVQTVKSIAKQAGLINYHQAIDVYHLNEQELENATITHSVFGRVKPEQKQKMIQTLKDHHFTTAMVGDGVNDVMALKTADCSIAMKDGSDAAKNVANLVLLDNDFSNMPYVVDQGRRVINNIQRTATLFLTKTVFSVLLSILTLFFISEYPFYPIQLTLISNCLIGLPAFFLSLEPNYQKVTGNFLSNILSKAIPCGLSIVFSIVVFECFNYFYTISSSHFSTMIVFSTILILFYVLLSLMKPLNLYRTTLLSLIIFSLLVCCFGLSHIFLIEPLFIEEYLLVLIVSSISLFVLSLLEKLKLSLFFTNIINKIN